MAYATLADLATYTGKESSAPGDERMLQRASDLVDEALASSYYVTDPVTGAATDANVIASLKGAVCAQVEWWRAVDDEIGGAWQRANLGGAALALYSAGQPFGRSRLCPRAREELRTKGIWQLKPLAW
jgi:hypothetical protein